MAAVWTILVQYFICVCGTILVARAEWCSKIVDLNKPANISCPCYSSVNIKSASILQDYSLTCGSKDCKLDDEDLNTFNETCQNSSTCLLDFKLQTNCSHDYGYSNITYKCTEANTYNCNFETRNCSWSMDGWERTNISTISSNDHTTGFDYGHFISIKNENPGSNSGQSNVTSQAIVTNQSKCLTFWYRIASINGQGQEISLIVYQKHEKGDALRLTLDKTTDSKWSFAFVLMEPVNIYNIVLFGRGRPGSIELDDIELYDGFCNDTIRIHCNFEQLPCILNVSSRNGTTWTWSHEASTAKTQDHTTESEKGHYQLTKAWFAAGVAYLESLYQLSSSSCLSFWYNIYGEYIDSFEIVKVQNSMSLGTRLVAIDLTRHDKWINQVIEIQDNFTPYWIMFVAKFGHNANSTERGIALDDITLTVGQCPGKTSTSSCHNMNVLFKIDECQGNDYIAGSLEIALQRRISSANLDQCNNTKEMAEQNIEDACRTYLYTNKTCEFYPSEFLLNVSKCYHVNNKLLGINYSCTNCITTSTTRHTETLFTTVDVTRSSTSPTASTKTRLSTSTTASTKTGSKTASTKTGSSTSTTASTKTGSSTFTTARSKTEVPDSAAQSPNTSNTTGIIVGVVCGFGFIVGLVIFLWCFMRRSKFVCKKSGSLDNKILSNDYTGNQSISLPILPNPMSSNDSYTEIQTSNDNYQHVNSNIKTLINKSGGNYAKLDQLKNLSDNKAVNMQHDNDFTHHDYIYILETNAGPTQTSINGPSINILHEEIQKNIGYAVIYPNNDRTSENDKHTKRVSSPPGNYAILDPNETGFFRSKGNTETTEYDLAVPITDNKCVSDLQDPYSGFENATYDSSRKVRHKEVDANIYSHSIENVYDTTSHEKKIVENDSTYDHFFVDQTEDHYNITKRV